MELAQLKRQVEQAVLTGELSDAQIQELGCLENEIWSEKRNYDMELLYAFMPFSMEYETRFHEKERYHAIQDVFKQAGVLADELTQDALANQRALGFYMMTLADCCDTISEEVFDHYKNLELAFKKTLHSIADKMEEMDEESRVMMAYAVLKACRIRMVLVEKYLPLGIRLYESAAGSEESRFKKPARQEYDCAMREE